MDRLPSTNCLRNSVSNWVNGFCGDCIKYKINLVTCNLWYIIIVNNGKINGIGGLMEKIETVSFNLIKKIFRHINRTEKQATLLTNRQKWDRLTSALYTLEDTSYAIEYYLESDYPADIKGKYLYTYGLLQALFVQEDAINSLSCALFDRRINFETEYPEAFAVREMRNDVVGHPTHREKSKYIYLAQHSLSKGSFCYSKDNSFTAHRNTINVDVYGAINETATCVNTILKNALEELDREFREYIEQHRSRKMIEIFNMLQYAREKTLIPNELDALGSWGYDATKDMVQKCEEELIKRYGTVEAVDSYKYLLDDIYEVYQIIDDDIPRIEVDSQERIKKYMLQILFSKLDELKNLCEETDKYFQSYGED